MIKHILVLIVFLAPAASYGGADRGALMPIGGIHYDSINKTNLRVGAAILLDRVEKQTVIDGRSHSHFSHSNFLFSEYLIGDETSAFGAGWGRFIGEGNFRVAMSHIERSDDALSGAEGSFNAYFYSFKAGVYGSNKSSDIKFLLGVGLGW